MVEKKSGGNSRIFMIVLMLMAVAGIGVFVYLRGGSDKVKQEAEVVAEAIPPASIPPASSVDRAAPEAITVIDAIENEDATVVEGQRYKVLVIDHAYEGSDGVARIGGMITFVPQSIPGDVAIIEITRIRRSTAQSILVEKLETGRPVPEIVQRTSRKNGPGEKKDDAPPSDMVGKTYRATITELGREGDGIAKIDGKVVFIPGATEGQEVEFRITADNGRFAHAEIISGDDAAQDNQEEKPKPRDEFTSAPGAVSFPVKPGEEHEVTIDEPDRRNPQNDGVTRINGYVVFVPGARVGERVRIRIGEVRTRAANAEVVERLGQAGTAP